MDYYVIICIPITIVININTLTAKCIYMNTFHVNNLFAI